jgi:Zn finger protein HypA/HybF involved in hydrogenase expression
VYKAEVFGDIQESYQGVYESMVCLNCKILADTCTPDTKVTNNKNLEIVFLPIEPHCLNCDKSDMIKWDSELCNCPKCESKMELTRMESNIDYVKTIKII